MTVLKPFLLRWHRAMERHEPLYARMIIKLAKLELERQEKRGNVASNGPLPSVKKRHR